MSEGSKLGNLIIEKVNGVECKQWIQATPKIHYPFDNNDHFEVEPEKVSRVIAYEKLDGTNILMFRYRNAEGHMFISYKTRGMPFMGAEFKFMWDEVLKMYPEIPTLVFKNGGKHVSFELYGMMNKHGIIYDVKLDTRVLFVRDEAGDVYPPLLAEVGNVGHSQVIKEWTNCEGIDFRMEYAAMEKWLTDQFKKEEPQQKEGEEYEFSGRGMEGTVWYANWKVGGWTLYKCKGEQVKEEHFKTASGIHTGHVNQAMFKVMEMDQPLTIESVIEALKSDWAEQDILPRHGMIRRMIESYEADKKLRTLLFAEYDRKHGEDATFDINSNKNRVMQYFAKWMDEQQMPRRYSAKVFTNLKMKYGVSI